MIGGIAFLAGVAVVSSGAIANPFNGMDVDHTGCTIYQGVGTLIGSDDGTRGTTQSWYADMDPGPNGYVVYPPTPLEPDGDLEVAGVADYTSISSGNISMEAFKFIGGSDVGNALVFFDFFDAGGGYVNSFGVILPQGGSFIWTINLGTPLDVAAGGFVQMVVDDEDLYGYGSVAAAQWFLGNAGASIGDAGAPEASPDFNFNFEIVGVPTPGVPALLGLGGVAAVRRRR